MIFERRKLNYCIEFLSYINYLNISETINWLVECAFTVYIMEHEPIKYHDEEFEDGEVIADNFSI